MAGRVTRSTTRRANGDVNNNGGSGVSYPVQRSPKKAAGRGHGQRRIDQSLKPTRNVRGHGRAYKRKGSDSSEPEDGVQISFDDHGGNEVVLIDECNYVPGTPEFTDCESETPSTSRNEVDHPATVSASAVAAVPASLAVENLRPEEQEGVLKDFDLNSLYGACRGMSRCERFKRAIRFNLQPPPSTTVQEVLKKLENEYTKEKKPQKDDGMFRSCIWDQNPLLRMNL